MYKIYIVEDDVTISTLLRENLEKWGFEAHCCEDFEGVSGEFDRLQPSLVLLDISLPSYNGYYWCAEIRKLSRAPIIFLSSHTENMDIVMAMNMGADDYVTKPFSMEVLVAKINALLRRTYDFSENAPAPAALAARGAVLHAEAGTLCVENNEIELTKNELRILKTLLEHKNSIVSRETIMTALWDSFSFVDDNTLTVNINRLRSKLDDAGLTDFITTKKGMGYAVYD